MPKGYKTVGKYLRMVQIIYPRSHCVTTLVEADIFYRYVCNNLICVYHYNNNLRYISNGYSCKYGTYFLYKDMYFIIRLYKMLCYMYSI